MGHTNSTANLALPQFIGTDKPTWLGDVNGAFAAIDAYAGTNDAAVAAAVSDASSAVSQASSAVNTANTANTTAGNASTAANNAVGVANTANAIAGTVDAKVGLLADLNTTDRSNIVNAINEVNSKVDNGFVSVTADGVKTYNQVLDELYALIDFTKISEKSVFMLASTVFQVISFDTLNSRVRFSKTGVTTNKVIIQDMYLTGNSIYERAEITSGTVTVSNESALTTDNGDVFKIIY